MGFKKKRKVTITKLKVGNLLVDVLAGDVQLSLELQSKTDELIGFKYTRGEPSGHNQPDAPGNIYRFRSNDSTAIRSIKFVLDHDNRCALSVGNGNSYPVTVPVTLTKPSLELTVISLLDPEKPYRTTIDLVPNKSVFFELEHFPCPGLQFS